MSSVTAPSGSSQKAIILLGAPKSGLSILKQLTDQLNQLVLTENGKVTLEQSAGTDPVTALNEQILRDLRLRWDMPFLPIGVSDDLVASRPYIEALIHQRYLDSALAAIRELAAMDRIVVLSDFRVTLFSSLWQKACVLAGLKPSFVFIHRNPLSVANALRAESNLGMPRGQQIWLRYTLAALDTLSMSDDNFALSYEDLVLGEENTLGILSQILNATFTTLSQFIQAIVKSQQLHDASLIELDRAITISSLVKKAYVLVQRWEHSSPEHRVAHLVDLKEHQDDYSCFSGNIVSVRYDKAKEVSETDEAKQKKFVILHYHLFKNAGTSVDAVLKKNFGKLWDDVEFLPPSQEDHGKAIQKFIAEHPDLVAVSSHTLFSPPPVFDKIDILPIIFVRHPLKRLRSAYDFERQQAADTVGAKLAKETDFAGYLKARLSVNGDRSCRNFQTHRLARLLPNDSRSERERALAALRQLPFVGLVEEFGKSMRELKAIIQPRIPSFQDYEAWENSTSDKHKSGAPKRPSLQEELGEETYAVMLEANQDDMVLYEEVVRKYAS